MGLLEKDKNSMLQLLFEFWSPMESKKREGTVYKCAS